MSSFPTSGDPDARDTGRDELGSPLLPPGAPQSLLTDLARGVFWIVVLRGVLAVLFGLLLLFAPALVAIAVGVYIGVWLVIDGILTIVNANAARRRGLPWGWELTAGIAYIVAGILIMLAPAMFTVVTGAVLLWLLAFGMLIRGILTLASTSFRGWSKALGVLDIVFAVIVMIMLFVSPGATVAALLWVIAVYTIVLGVALIAMAIVARSQAKREGAAR
ncbi:uncharacterized membrane protein HdeD (DUF308 family) [Brevibacterium sanguinis]|uniref:Uncharacterized membrane protein HdeD (DUF308 family) n=2 Tax=Brevibacterium TaxID=1696 RepID=A0A366IJI6_9MICO|nr:MULTISPECIES: DUF308 domain-containing protein [Brevibacterium]RBP65431.1 uncharacterized membrane protein HdeD (DUF308 family) [Brevibacterium sanguinis]RBP72065.1 uncharacterized membrane protein HdeD (DUF308 family) [Brevibacterium celere]